MTLFVPFFKIIKIDHLLFGRFFSFVKLMIQFWVINHVYLCSCYQVMPLCAACANELKGVRERENLHEIMCTQNANLVFNTSRDLSYFIKNKKNKEKKQTADDLMTTLCLVSLFLMMSYA